MIMTIVQFLTKIGTIIKKKILWYGGIFRVGRVTPIQLFFWGGGLNNWKQNLVLSGQNIM